jgi:lambda repressor-like predicted transcriptional regulator
MLNRILSGNYRPRGSGEFNSQSKLTWAAVADIRTRSEQGVSRRVLAREYGVAHDTIAQVVRGQSWRSDNLINESMRGG